MFNVKNNYHFTKEIVMSKKVSNLYIKSKDQSKMFLLRL